MKLLWHMPTLQTSCCGLSRRAIRLAEQLRSRGHSVTLAVRADKTNVPGGEVAGTPVVRLNPSRATLPHWSLQSRARVIDARRLVAGLTMPHDVFLTGQPEAALAYAMRRDRRPLVFVCGGSVLLHEEAERQDQARYVWWRRAPFLLDRLLRRRVERDAARAADAVVFNSRTTHDRLRDVYHLKEARCHVILGGLDADEFKPADSTTKSALRRALAIAEGDRVLTWTGRLSPEKNLRLLFESVRRLRHRRLLVQIVGDGPCRDEWTELTRLFGQSDHIRFYGRQDDVKPFLWASDLFVFPSRGESFGGSLVEAMGCGLACVALRADGRRIRNASAEIINHGRTGWLSEPMPELLADAVDFLLDNPELCRRLGESARQNVATRFTWTGAAESLISVLDRLVAKPIHETVDTVAWLPALALGD